MYIHLRFTCAQKTHEFGYLYAIAGLSSSAKESEKLGYVGALGYSEAK